MIRVLYDHQIFETQPMGGISRYYAELLPRLREQGVAAHLFTGLNVSRFRFDATTLASLRGLRSSIRGTARVAPPINRVLFRRHARRIAPQIYHSTSYRDLAPDLDALRVVTVHDLVDARVGRVNLGSPWSVSTTRGRRVDGYLCISENTRRDLIELYGVDPARTAVVYHASDLAPPDVPPPPAERPYVLYVGSRWSYKNSDALLAAFARSTRLATTFDLLFFGHTASPAERARLAALAPGARLRFAGGDDRALAAAYAGARAFVYPSLYEGFGMPLLEAMRCDCPVVASNTSCFPEIAADAAEYFDPTDVDSLIRALEAVAFDDARRADLIARGRVRKQAFSWARAAEQTASFYRQALAMGRA